MTVTEFNKVLDARLLAIQNTLRQKADEYATDDRLYNFKEGAKVLRSNKFHVLLAFLTKHVVSIYDIAEKAGQGIATPLPVIQEKIGDAICYLILAEGMFHEPMPVTPNVLLPQPEMDRLLKEMKDWPLPLQKTFVTGSPTAPPVQVTEKPQVCVAPVGSMIYLDGDTGERYYKDPHTGERKPAYRYPNEP